MELPAVRRTQPITIGIGQKFFNNPCLIFYNCCIANNNNTDRVEPVVDGKAEVVVVELDERVLQGRGPTQLTSKLVSLICWRQYKKNKKSARELEGTYIFILHRRNEGINSIFVC